MMSMSSPSRTHASLRQHNGGACSRYATPCKLAHRLRTRHLCRASGQTYDGRPRFTDKAVLVTGGSSGMGLATAERLASEGANVALVGRTASKLEEAAANIKKAYECEVITITADVANVADNEKMVEEVVDKFGKLDAAFLNAGVGAIEKLSDATEESYAQVFDINSKGILFGIQKCAAAMKAAGTEGAILVNSSGLGHHATSSMPLLGIYAASKAGADMFVRYAAMEYAEDGIRVNAIAPGVVWTPMMGEPLEEMNKWAGPMHLVGRAGHAEEIASLATFMLSDEASFITGSIHTVDGGWQLKA